jgi:hypothetical protein
MYRTIVLILILNIYKINNFSISSYYLFIYFELLYYYCNINDLEQGAENIHKTNSFSITQNNNTITQINTTIF